MDDEIQVAWHPEFGSLYLNCSPESFALLATRILEQVPNASEIELREIKGIEIRDREARKPTKMESRRDRIALLGCGVVGFVLLFIFILGLIEVISLFSS